MKKSPLNRRPLRLQVNLHYDNAMYTGTVTILSEHTMYIETEMIIPFKSEFKVLVALIDEVIEVPVRVKTLKKTDRYCNCMGVELINPPPYYLEFVSRMTSIC